MTLPPETPTAASFPAQNSKTFRIRGSVPFAAWARIRSCPKIDAAGVGSQPGFASCGIGLFLATAMSYCERGRIKWIANGNGRVPLEDLKTNLEPKTGHRPRNNGWHQINVSLPTRLERDGNLRWKQGGCPKEIFGTEKEARGINCRGESTDFRKEAFTPGGWNKSAANGWDPEGNSV